LNHIQSTVKCPIKSKQYREQLELNFESLFGALFTYFISKLEIYWITTANTNPVALRCRMSQICFKVNRSSWGCSGIPKQRFCWIKLIRFGHKRGETWENLIRFGQNHQKHPISYGYGDRKHLLLCNQAA